jgi:hypothetical protein
MGKLLSAIPKKSQSWNTIDTRYNMGTNKEKELQIALDNLFKSAEYRKVCELTQELTDKGLNNPSLERAIDETLICRGAWIYDTINGKCKRGKGLLYKVRKAIGYTYP